MALAAVRSKVAILLLLLHNVCPGYVNQYFVSFIVCQLSLYPNWLVTLISFVYLYLLLRLSVYV